MKEIDDLFKDTPLKDNVPLTPDELEKMEEEELAKKQDGKHEKSEDKSASTNTDSNVKE
jgi:hypothetical protein